MAKLLAVDGWVKGDSVGSYLRENLPGDYYVVADTRVCGRQLAAVVVGRRTLFAIEDFDGKPADEPGGLVGQPDAGSASEAADRFLKDEFPGVKVLVVVVQGLRDWAAEPLTWRVMEPAQSADQSLAEALMAADTDEGSLLDDAAREELAIGLRDRQLTASQIATRPFVFRSGRGFRTGTRVSTVRAATAHMARYPADGVMVLRDGTLARWLDEEGAHHLADLAREVVRQSKADMRISLENFLLGSGLVARPAMIAKPARLDLGYVLQGQKANRRLRLEKGRTRGYLFGEAAGAAPWLHIEPRTFAGTPAEFVVTAATVGLQIRSEPYHSEVAISSSASAVPISIPLTFRVVVEPPRSILLVVRPLIGLLLGGLLGAFFGFLWHLTLPSFAE